MPRRIVNLLRKPYVLAPLLKGVAYGSTTTALICPKLFWLFTPIAVISGTTFYIILGASTLNPLITRFRRLGKQCKVGDFDEEGRVITRHDCWF
jgi:hypothetical protein